MDQDTLNTATGEDNQEPIVDEELIEDGEILDDTDEDDSQYEDDEDGASQEVVIQSLEDVGTTFEGVIDGRKCSVTFKRFVPIFSNKGPAPGAVFTRMVEDKQTGMLKEAYPIQFSGFTGGTHIYQVLPPNHPKVQENNGNQLDEIISWGYDRTTRTFGKPKYAAVMRGNGDAWADLIFGAVSTVLDTQEGIDFKAWLQTEEAKEKTLEGRVERRNFKKMLAVLGDHGATQRQSEKGNPADYKRVALARAQNRATQSQARTEDRSLAGLF